MLNAGDVAPDFKLLDPDMRPVTLSDWRGKMNVVVYFYPKDDTPGCTIEAQDFTGLMDEMERHDTMILGISPDDCVSHSSFIEKYGLGIQLLVDLDMEVASLYGVWVEKEKNGLKKMMINRSTFIIDKEGKVMHALYGVAPRGHAAKVMELVKEL